MVVSKVPTISVISPVYEAEKIVDQLVFRISEEVSKITDSYEVILVEDGSMDDSWFKIEQNCLKNDKVKGVKLSRNFGQHYAVTAGLAAATGKVIIIMDCDLQDDPKYISVLYDEFKKGFDVVFSRRIGRKHSFFKSLTVKIYNFLFRLISDKNFDLNLGSLTLISDRVKKEFVRLKDHDRLYTQLIKWIGFRSTYIPVEHKERHLGKSTYSVPKLIFMAWQGWTSHSDKLLKLWIYSGFLLSLISFLVGLYIIFLFFFHGFQPGWPSLFVAILFSTGLILMSVGIAGMYIGKILEQAKERPLFIIDKKINLE